MLRRQFKDGRRTPVVGTAMMRGVVANVAARLRRVSSLAHRMQTPDRVGRRHTRHGMRAKPTAPLPRSRVVTNRRNREQGARRREQRAFAARDGRVDLQKASSLVNERRSGREWANPRLP
jgi:hypothetical protein